MPFLSPDNPIFFNQRPRGLVGWLRAIFVEDLGLKLLALGITLFLWFIIAGQRSTITVPLRHVPVSFRYASDLDITDEPREVEVTLTGSKQAIDRLNANEMVAVIDISTLRPGERVVHLNSATVTMNLPDGIRLDNVEPKSIPIHLEPRIPRQIEIAAKLTGKPADGYEVRQVTIDPLTAEVRGPASRVNALAKAETEPLSVEGLSADHDFPQTAIVVANPKLTLIDTIANITVHIGELRVERTIPGVKISSTGAVVTVTVFGDRSAVQALKPEDLQLEPLATGGGAYHLILPAQYMGRVELRTVR